MKKMRLPLVQSGIMVSVKMKLPLVQNGTMESVRMNRAIPYTTT